MNCHEAQMFQIIGNCNGGYVQQLSPSNSIDTRSDDHDGTVGLTINRGTGVPISRGFNPLREHGGSDPIYMGGPVETEGGGSCLRQDLSGFNQAAS